MRVQTVRVSSIELLFKVTNNPFLLAVPEVLRTTPTLFVLALLASVLPLAVTFPPGALIVISAPVGGSYSAVVPTYNVTNQLFETSPALWSFASSTFRYG
jgi:hypothetical protein